MLVVLAKEALHSRTVEPRPLKLETSIGSLKETKR